MAGPSGHEFALAEIGRRELPHSRGPYSGYAPHYIAPAEPSFAPTYGRRPLCKSYVRKNLSGSPRAQVDSPKNGPKWGINADFRRPH